MTQTRLAIAPVVVAAVAFLLALAACSPTPSAAPPVTAAPAPATSVPTGTPNASPSALPTVASVELPSPGGTCDTAEFTLGQPQSSYGYSTLGSVVLFVGITARNDGPHCVMNVPNRVGVASGTGPVEPIPVQITTTSTSIDVMRGETVSITLGDSWWIGMTDSTGATVPPPPCDGQIQDTDHVIYPFGIGTIRIDLDMPWRELCSDPPSVTLRVEIYDPSQGVLPTPGPAAATPPCSASQIRVTTGTSGAAAGTAYLRLFVDLAQGPACSIARGPRVSIVSADGSEVQAGSEADTTPVTLDANLAYELGWNVGCGMPDPPRPLSVRIEFSAAAVITMPIGDFGPSCVDGSTGVLFLDVMER